MASITTRAGKGSPLTHNEVDANFTNLNTDKVEKSGTDPVVINANSASTALIVTQSGSGNALVVEDQTSDTTPFVITAAGNVGIGTTGPAAKLSIENGSLIVQNASSAAVTDLGIRFDLDANTQGRIYSPTGKSIALQAGTAGTLTDAVTIDQSGRVGIGTTSPGESLHVAGNAQIGAANSNNCYVELGKGATGNRNVFIDFIGDTTYADYGFRLIRGNGEANAATDFRQRGTGGVAFINEEVAPFAWFVSGSERARIDSSGRLLVGTSSARSNFYGSITPGGVHNEAGYGTFFANTNNAQGAALYLGKSRGTTALSNTIVQVDDDLGVLVFFGADGTSAIPAAQILAEVDGTPGTNDMPGRLVFSTTADGASSPTERMRIDSSGRVGIGTTSPGAPLHVQGFASYRGNAFTIASFSANDTLAPLNIVQRENGTHPGISAGQNSGGTFQPLSFLTSEVERLSITAAGTSTFNSAASTAPFVAQINSSEVARIDASGRLLVGTSTQSGGSLLQVNGDRIRVATSKTPASASDTGVAGEICWDADYVYVCTATNTWKRSALSTW